MNWKKLCALALTATMGLGLFACGEEKKGGTTPESKPAAQADAGKTSSDKKELNIAVILKTTASEYWGYVQAGALSYMKKNPDVKVEVTGAASETAYDEQLSKIETALGSNSYDGFVISPLQADVVSKTIKGTKFPIIAVDTDIQAPEVLSFVGTGNKAAASLGGKKAVEVAKANGWSELKAISISGVQGDNTATARLEGYEEGVKNAGGQFLADETQYANAVADQAVTSMEAIMQKHPEGIAMILCHNDDTAMAAAKAAKNNKAYEKTVFVGFDGIISACNAILEGQETLSVGQQAFDMGYKAVEACVKAIRGEKIEKFIDSGAIVVDKDTAEKRKAELQAYLDQK